MKNIAIYYRCSTDKQDFASQEEVIGEWLKSLPQDKKPKSISIYKDEGISGSTTNRPAFQAMLEAASAGKLDTILVYKLDRFSRDATSAIKLILSLDEAGVAFISVTQPVLNLGHENPFRRTMLSAFAEIAEIERETIVARVKAGLDAARKRGVKLGRRPSISKETRRRVVELKESGLSIRKIAKELSICTGSVQNILTI